MSKFLVCFDVGRDRLEIESDDSVNLLEVIRSAGVPVRQACRNGVCRVCRCRLVDGDISYRNRAPHGLEREDIDQGYILPCIAYAESDLFIEDVRSKLGVKKA